MAHQTVEQSDYEMYLKDAESCSFPIDVSCVGKGVVKGRQVLIDHPPINEVKEEGAGLINLYDYNQYSTAQIKVIQQLTEAFDRQIWIPRVANAKVFRRTTDYRIMSATNSGWTDHLLLGYTFRVFLPKR